MKKIIVFVLTILVLNLFGQDGSFDYASYQDYTLEQINAANAEYLKKYGKGGSSWHLSKYKIRIKLENYTSPIDKGSLNILENYKRLANLSDAFTSTYQNEMIINYKGRRYCFLFQKNVAPFLEKEVKIGDNVDLFVISGFYNSFNNTNTILVTDFRALN
ncbi:hypothetical protein [Leptospira stimsonii]|uniref:Uncharacterized protein n=1 Tax=Leptospira stimsonii TaxID=2202203 RepID=A0A4R9L960_9LEPT|nr:hypothetical protein [Leptospira stimsonii]RHX83581.1 hypothetical protein DLM78_21570 [Leptospira stimsonii]TGK23596.1 hypothetical protein EHO98_04920 [Leptospira stimsonii]TGM17234.1 hypothetical protein EHQ90_07840 [Leptospira stimsonii]